MRPGGPRARSHKCVVPPVSAVRRTLIRPAAVPVRCETLLRCRRLSGYGDARLAEVVQGRVDGVGGDVDGVVHQVGDLRRDPRAARHGNAASFRNSGEISRPPGTERGGATAAKAPLRVLPVPRRRPMHNDRRSPARTRVFTAGTIRGHRIGRGRENPNGSIYGVPIKAYSSTRQQKRPGHQPVRVGFGKSCCTQQHRSSFYLSTYIEQWTPYLPTDISTTEAIASTLAPWTGL